ncbi:Ldh family oxidoreductase [Salicibibacter kimchii]|uniref:Ldh family oxidoreductase n=1 Tax=Salicibibacter kimchii TaxID=2099786 RepID=A0A345BWG2_9BACI|nr:Ldh family oxidoreductase [Salicibibacter kimchii]
MVRETAVSALLDGNNQLGILSATEGINLAIDKAKQTGVGIIGINNSNHCGMLADYTGYAAEQGYVAMATTNTPPNMAPWGGKERYFGTNPFSYAVPTGNGPPIIFDMATSVVARGKIKLAVKNNTKIPIGWALTKDGEPTTDAREAMEGVVLPVGGAKGYGLAFLVEVLSGLFTGAGFASHIGRPEDLQTRQNIGQFYFVMRADLFQEIEEFYHNVAKLKEEIRTIPLAKGYERIYLPGEIEQEKMLKRKQEGIPLSDEVISEINDVAESYGVNNRLE